MAAGVDAGVVSGVASLLPPGAFRTTESAKEAHFQWHKQEMTLIFDLQKSLQPYL